MQKCKGVSAEASLLELCRATQHSMMKIKMQKCKNAKEWAQRQVYLSYAKQHFDDEISKCKNHCNSLRNYFIFNIGWWQDFPGNSWKHILPLYNPLEWRCLWGWSNQRKPILQSPLPMEGWRYSWDWSNQRKHSGQSLLLMGEWKCSRGCCNQRKHCLQFSLQMEGWKYS